VHLLKALALDPKHPIDQLGFNMGLSSFILGDDDASIAWFQKTVTANPTYFDAYGWMAMAYTRKGDMAKAKEFAEALKKADPKGSFQTRRRPMASAPPAYRKFYDEVYLPVAKKAGEYKLGFPVYKDDKGAAVEALKAEATPEAFVLDHNFVLRYRGRIDDAYSARLKKNPKITSHDLKAAHIDVRRYFKGLWVGGGPTFISSRVPASDTTWNADDGVEWLRQSVWQPFVAVREHAADQHIGDQTLGAPNVGGRPRDRAIAPDVAVARQIGRLVEEAMVGRRQVRLVHCLPDWFQVRIVDRQPFWQERPDGRRPTRRTRSRRPTGISGHPWSRTGSPGCSG